MFDISFLNKEEKENVLPQLFDLLFENMNQIDPTGNTSEQDFQTWMKCIVPELETDERNILLIKCDGRLAGFFQYSVKESTLYMEEIQLYQEYWGSGAFSDLYRFLASIIPETISQVRANASKNNLKSQAILNHLGLNKIGENKTGKSYRYLGNCQNMLKKYREAFPRKNGECEHDESFDR